MRTFGTLLLAYLVSGLIAGMVQLQLGIALKADMEFIIAMIVLAAMTLVTTVALGIALGTASSIMTIDRVATVLLGFTVLAVLALMIFDFIDTRSIAISRDSLAILIEIAIPTIIMITIQWWLVRRRWRKAHAGAETM
jgi:hypothetical protein